MEQTSPWWGQSLSIILKAKVRFFAHYRPHACLCPEYLCTKYSRLPIAYFVFSFLIFTWPKPSFSQKMLRKRNVLTAGGKTSIRTLFFLSLFSLHQIHLFLQKDWGKERFLLLQAVKKYCPLCLFLSLFSLWPNPPFSQKRLRKKMDVAQTHFGAALYRLCVMLCTFGACDST